MSMGKGIVGVVVGVVIVGAVMVYTVGAGDLDAPAAPTAAGSAMYTLEDVYNRIDDGTVGTKRAGAFTEPSSGPASTGYDLYDLYDVASKRSRPPKTGQTASLVTGDDGDLEKGVTWPSPRFTDNGDGTVTDNLTGLIWLKNANRYGTRSWANALSDANGLNTGECGLADGSSAGDWRLPNVRELQSLIDYGKFDPALPSDHPFSDVKTNDDYWSSTTMTGLPTYALYVAPYYGYVRGSEKTGTPFYVWPVRGGQ